MARVGVLLLNLGGPERIEDVGPFLYNLFADPEIIRLPTPALQKPLAWLISRGGIRDGITKLEEWLQHKAEWLVGVLALVLGAYLLYEGLHGLNVMHSINLLTVE